MEVGARWFEFDVDITGDGSLIVIHDDTLDRTTTGSGSYYHLGFSDIRRLDAGRWFSDTYRFERIPEATDVLAFAHAQQMGRKPGDQALRGRRPPARTPHRGPGRHARRGQGPLATDRLLLRPRPPRGLTTRPARRLRSAG